MLVLHIRQIFEAFQCLLLNLSMKTLSVSASIVEEAHGCVD
jgi:hypothetical protein